MNTNVNVNIAKDLNVNVARELKRAYPDRRKLECQVMEVTTMMIFNLGGDNLHACFLVQLSIATNNLHFGSRILDDLFLLVMHIYTIYIHLKIYLFNLSLLGLS